MTSDVCIGLVLGLILALLVLLIVVYGKNIETNTKVLQALEDQEDLIKRMEK